ncbi:MAG: twin-arginine translocase TatA/TatE family subunit [Planctomycetes bacterium]|nr:twin-arginine translocase TatA/TatE family subunit [Planctomycetota bacterium]
MIAFVNHWELIVVLVVVLVLFGNRIPGMMRSLGSGITEFKRGLKDGNKPDGGGGSGGSLGNSKPGETPNDGAPR